MNKLTLQDELTEFLLYNDGNGDVRVETYLHNVVAQILNWVALLELTR
jgi:hypothetical protein